MSEIDLTSQEVKDAIAAAVAEEVKGLKAKNAELIEANKKLRKNAEIDPAELEAVERERDEWKEKAGEATKALGKAAKELEAANKRAADTENAFTSTLKDAALTEALTKAGVTPALLKAAKALHSASLQVVDDNGSRVVKAGDKALGEFITEWAGSDEGKHFVAAGDSNGGGSQSGRSQSPPSGNKQPDVTDKAARAALYAERLANATD